VLRHLAKRHEGPVEIDVEHLAPTLEARLQRIVVVAEARIREAGVDAAELLDRRSAGLLDRGFAGDVAGNGQRAHAQLLEIRRGCLALIGIARPDRDVGARARQPARHPEADSLAAAGHDGNPSAQVEDRARSHLASLRMAATPRGGAESTTPKVDRAFTDRRDPD
jgi:hypothetical protein